MAGTDTAIDPVAALLERTTRESNVPMVPTDPATLARIAAVVRRGGGGNG